MTLYEKRGRRYCPVQDTMAYDGLANGSWLVVVENGCTSIRKLVTPDHAAVAAAIPPVRDKLAQAIREAMNKQPVSRSKAGRLTPKERRAFKAYHDVMGKDAWLIMTLPAARDAAETVLRSLVSGETNDSTHRHR